MGKGGLIIRFIDVGLLVLFGFIVISDIKVETQIKMPTPANSPTPPEEWKIVEVQIKPEGQLELDNSPIASLDAMRDRLRNLHRDFGDSMVVSIDDRNTRWKYVVQVKDVCERENWHWTWFYGEP